MIELTPILNTKSEKPIYIQLTNYIKKEIIAGSIRPKEKLPSKRKLSQHLGISLNTIQASYDQLCAEGYVRSIQRKGYFVTDLDNSILLSHHHPHPLQINNRKAESTNIKVDYNVGRVDLEKFPYTLWRKLTIQSLYEDQGELFNFGHPQGEISLRELIVKHLFASRGVRCSADQVVIGAGTQQLISQLCTIIGINHVFAFENPGFNGTMAVIKNQVNKTAAIPVDEDGINMQSLRQSGASVVYVTPSHQFPLGMVMPISRRIDLLKWAHENKGYIIEDDYDGEFRYKGKPIPSLQGLDKYDNVIYLGSFSKSLIPSIRISYMILPPHLIDRYKEYFSIYKQAASRLHQDTLFRFMKEGYWDSHLNKMRTLYRKKQNMLITSITNDFGNQVNIIGEKSGLHIILEVSNEMVEEELVTSALEVGVKVYPLSTYYDESTKHEESKVILGYGGLSEAEIIEGIKLLKGAWKL
ncbi:PLP-dependent aminotransferase family protein [Bacillus sp. SCS-151]|uniref:MocR-like pyridoxine biosynthesis transcription factor PdxR n=1 Tax=Nanhaiella sioensis TaxID=3115293 RepID=UPI00397E6BF1